MMNKDMKRHIIIKYMQLLLAFAMSAMFVTACSDWTDTESVDLIEPSIDGQNSQLYAKYLENLRAYKQTEHKLVYVWFDNSNKIPASRAQHITDVPDSVDVISLMSPGDLANWELKDIETVRKDKGTKVIYTIDFDAIKAAYNEKMELATDEEPMNQDFTGFLIDSLETALSFVEKYNYDGICVAYTGKSRLHMREAELREYTANENAFINIMADWYGRHQNKMIVFYGNPQNLIDPALVQNARSILIPATTALSLEHFSFLYEMGKAENVPTDRYGLVVNAIDLTDVNQVIGYLNDGSLAIDGLAKWATSPHAGMEVTAVGIYNVSSDYYNPQQIYNHTRAMISSINPSVK